MVFFFNDTATTEIYTLSLHDALPISQGVPGSFVSSVQARKHSSVAAVQDRIGCRDTRKVGSDRKSTRLNSSHANISYAVFCLKKKKIINKRYNGVRLDDILDDHS